MAETQTPADRADGSCEPNHGMRIFIIWLVLAVAADLLYLVRHRAQRASRRAARPLRASSSTSTVMAVMALR